MDRDNWKYTYEFLFRYANRVRVAIRDRIRRDGLIDTGALLESIDYDIEDGEDGFNVTFRIGDGNFVYGSGLPSEYGVYQDQGTRFIAPHYFFSAPIPGLTVDVFTRGLREAMQRDTQRMVDRMLREEEKSRRRS